MIANLQLRPSPSQGRSPRRHCLPASRTVSCRRAKSLCLCRSSSQLPGHQWASPEQWNAPGSLSAAQQRPWWRPVLGVLAKALLGLIAIAVAFFGGNVARARADSATRPAAVAERSAAGGAVSQRTDRAEARSSEATGVSYTGIDLADGDEDGPVADDEAQDPVEWAKRHGLPVLDKATIEANTHYGKGDPRPPHRPAGLWVRMHDPTASMATDYTDWPADQREAMKMGVVTAWRTDKLREMSYSQFLIHVREGHIDSVRYTNTRKSLIVTTKPSAPGGARTETVGLIYDPMLYDYLCSHGVYVDVGPPNRMLGLQMGLIRAFAPFLLAILIVKFSFSLGRKRKPDRLFGGARLQYISSNDIPITFDDIAGIDEVKSEIQEIVAFLKNQELFLQLGARSPAGVLLVGAPGTGKTLLAKAIAGEAGVPFFASSGTDFTEMFVGVGAARVRDMFVRARKNAPCILFIDEFDGIGQARSQNAAGNDESVHTINQLLTEMDGFDDNTGVIVLAATNRPASLDEALTRPGRFDRIISLPLPNLEGRVGILKVHSRDKEVAPDLDYNRIARATAGFTGADLMNLMNTSAMEAVRQEREVITEEDVFQALEKIHTEKFGGGQSDAQYEDGAVTPLIRRSIATYMAAKALIGSITPDYDELQKVVVTPKGAPTGYTYFIPQDAHLESCITTRSFMEGHLVVALAGRVAEQAVMGAANMTAAGGHDLRSANALAREMIFRCGWSKRLGPISIMDETENYLSSDPDQRIANMAPQTACNAIAEIEELLAAAEAKAFFGLIVNWEALQAVVEQLLLRDNHTLNRVELEELLQRHKVKHFKDSLVSGFDFKQDRTLQWPERYDDMVTDRDETAAGRPSGVPIVSHALSPVEPHVHPLNPYQMAGQYAPRGLEVMLGDEYYFKPEVWRTLRDVSPRQNGGGPETSPLVGASESSQG